MEGQELYFWSPSTARYRLLIREEPGPEGVERFWLEMPGERLLSLRRNGGGALVQEDRPENRFTLLYDDPPPGTSAGRVRGLRPPAFVGEELWRRLDPPQDLPSIGLLMERLGEAHGIRHLATLGALELRGRAETLDGEMAGPARLVVDGVRGMLAEVDFGLVRQRLAVVGESVRRQVGNAPPEALMGLEADQHRIERPEILFGDWRVGARRVVPVHAVEIDSEPAWAVRVVPSRAYPVTRYLSRESGRLLAADQLLHLPPGERPVGVRCRYGDYRRVGGVLLPFAVRCDYARQALGGLRIRYATWRRLKGRSDPLRFAGPPTEDGAPEAGR